MLVLQITTFEWREVFSCGCYSVLVLHFDHEFASGLHESDYREDGSCNGT